MNSNFQSLFRLVSIPFQYHFSLDKTVIAENSFIYVIILVFNIFLFRMYTKIELRQAKDAILSAKKIAAITHKNPDFDALGSGAAIYEILKKLGKKVTIYSPGKFPDNYSFIPHIKKFKVFEGNKVPDKKYDLLILLDGSELSRFVKEGELEIPADLKTMVIDHHPAKKVKTDYYLHSSKIASASEIVFDLFKFSEWKITKNIAKSLLIGILGDTGWLRYEKTSAETLKKTAELLEINNCLVNLDYHFTHISKTDYISLWQKLIDNVKVDKETSFIYTFVKYTDIKKSKISEADLSTAYHAFQDAVLRRFSDIDISLVLLERMKGIWKGSMRSETGSVKVNKICEDFEIGGGHPRAGGFETRKNFDEVMKIIYSRLKKYRIK